MNWKAILAVLQIAVSLGLVAAIVRSLLRWRIDLYGQAAFKPISPGHRERLIAERKMPDDSAFLLGEASPYYAYTFAIRNAEEATLVSPFSIEIAIDKQGERFGVGPDDPPKVYCGFRSRHAGTRVSYRRNARLPSTECDSNHIESRAVFVVDVERLAPRETWVIRFGTRAASRHVSLRIRRGPGYPNPTSWLGLVGETELRLDESTEGGYMRSKLVRQTWFQVVALCELLYLIPILNHDIQWVPGGWYFRGIEWGDAIVAVIILLCAALVYQANRYKPAPFVQGYAESGTDRVGGTAVP